MEDAIDDNLLRVSFLIGKLPNIKFFPCDYFLFGR